ncbi:DUF7736 domain-containing protein [Enterococcus sp. BWR-S5]|uniref:DUF7736 domain-containing protein n=1 Tax=Enterococcus sp. BWR-S5 TaxID=2787714 RepID=UPI0019208BAB|nr:hypothetical protein [Enterococcus sp. BWR-S5]MBL1227134.1 hypothetical protein [Enterococcus sp. BWR-S5]
MALTKREAAIITAHTGILIGEMDSFKEYVDEILERPLLTHEIPNFENEIKERSKEDFIAITVTPDIEINDAYERGEKNNENF